MHDPPPVERCSIFEDRSIWLNAMTVSPPPITVQVDMGAVPYVCNGANVMSAGINDASKEIVKGQYVWIREESHHKPLGVVKALLDRNEMLSLDKGKAIQAFHYIGDKIWSYGVKD